MGRRGSLYSTVDSTTHFDPKFAHGVVERTATVGIVRDNKSIASINADGKSGIPAGITSSVAM
jgi:hypothetical protein